MLVKCICVALWITTSVIITFAATEEGPQIGKNSSNWRIYIHGGRPVEEGEFPFLAFLVIITPENKTNSCSGSIPSPTTVLTSAHCDVGNITAYSGMANNSDLSAKDNKRQVRHVESVRKPQFPEFYDIMICFVNQSWEWTAHVAPIPLQLGDVRIQPSFVISCQVLGFGQTKPNGSVGVAHTMQQLIGSSSQCFHRQPLLWFFSFWMCSINIENKTICGGDSGGPAVCKQGNSVTQWAVNMGKIAEEDNCVPQKGANVYVAIYYFRKWILDNIKDMPSGASSVQRRSLKILISKARSNQLLWLLFQIAIAFACPH